MKKRKYKKIKRINNAMRVRTLSVAALIAILFIGLMGRLVYFSVAKNKTYKKKVLAQQNYQSQTLPYKRGDILDRNGNTLATSQKLYSLVLEPKNILRTEQTQKNALNALAEYMNLNRDDLMEYLKEHKDSYYSVYKKDMKYSKVADLKDFLKSKNGKKVVGITFSEKYVRRYPNKSLASHLLGFVSDSTIGTTGIEQYYNSSLTGVDGRKYTYLNEELEHDDSIVDPENGKTLVSTIDVNIQKIAEDRLAKFEKKYGSKGSSILVMDPNNGEVLAMANSNTYDLEHPRDDKALLTKYSQSQIDRMSEKQKVKAFNEIWKNPIVSNSFEPGSTYKPFTVAGGLEEGILKGNETYYCKGYKQVGKHKIHCSHQEGHGSLTLSDSIAYSCNVALMDIAAKEGKNVFAKYQKDFNFGVKTGIDLPAEAETAGLLYSADEMTSVDLATSSFGQTFNCSMIQMASSFSSLVNGGYYYKPHVVKQTRDDKGNVLSNKNSELVKQTISADTSKKIRSYMKETVEKGTGKKAKIKGYSVGGKTGTAQKIPRSAKTYIVSFCGFAPVENPKVVVYVVIDEIQRDSQLNTGLAVEMARDVLKESLKDMNVPKTKK